jgi:hypothetical protein
MIWNQLWGSKEARYIDQPDISNLNQIVGAHKEIFNNDYESLGEPTEVVSISINWGINEDFEKEILRVSVVNQHGLLLFDSLVNPLQAVCYVPFGCGYLYDPSFGIPIKYLVEMLNIILD